MVLSAYHVNIGKVCSQAWQACKREAFAEYGALRIIENKKERLCIGVKFQKMFLAFVSLI